MVEDRDRPPPVSGSDEALLAWALDHISLCAACRAWTLAVPYEVACEDRNQLSPSQRALVLASFGFHAVEESEPS